METHAVDTAGIFSLTYLKVIVEILLFALVGGVVIWERVSRYLDDRREHARLLDRLLNPVPAQERLRQLGNGGPTDLPVKEIGQRVLLAEEQVATLRAEFTEHAAFVRKALGESNSREERILAALGSRPCMAGDECPIPTVGAPHE